MEESCRGRAPQGGRDASPLAPQSGSGRTRCSSGPGATGEGARRAQGGSSFRAQGADGRVQGRSPEGVPAAPRLSPLRNPPLWSQQRTAALRCLSFRLPLLPLWLWPVPATASGTDAAPPVESWPPQPLPRGHGGPAGGAQERRRHAPGEFGTRALRRLQLPDPLGQQEQTWLAVGRPSSSMRLALSHETPRSTCRCVCQVGACGDGGCEHCSQCTGSCLRGKRPQPRWSARTEGCMSPSQAATRTTISHPRPRGPARRGPCRRWWRSPRPSRFPSCPRCRRRKCLTAERTAPRDP